MSTNATTMGVNSTAVSGTGEEKKFFGAPSAKVSVGVLAAAVTTLLFTIPSLKIHFDASQGAAMTTLLTFLIQYVVPDRN
jgi:hypothetical protein